MSYSQPPLPLLSPPAWLAALAIAKHKASRPHGGANRVPARAAVKEIDDLIKAGNKQQAIDRAIRVYGIDKSKVKSLTYDAAVEGEAVSTKDGTVKVGDAAFRNAGWLGSSLGHEIEVHVNKQAIAGKWYQGRLGTALQEVQAYDYEIANARRYGTTPENLQDLKDRRASYYRQLTHEYQKRAAAGNYNMKRGEEGF